MAFPLVITGALSFLAKHWDWLLLGVIALILAGGVWHYHHTREQLLAARATIATMEKEHKKEKEAWQEEVKRWNAIVEQQKRELELAKQQKEAIVKQERKKFDSVFKKVVKVPEVIRNEVKLVVRPNDDVVVPTGFVRLYNDAVEGSRVAAEGGEVRVSKDRSDLLGKSNTFDAVAFTEVVIENLYKYNELALRCNSLIDIVLKLERTYGTTYSGGTGGDVAELGGDSIDGRIAAQLF